MLLQAGPTNDLKVAMGAFLVLFFIWLSSTLYYRKRVSYPLPPGPPGKFLVGNLGGISEHPELDYERWGKEYSKSSTEENQPSHTRQSVSGQPAETLFRLRCYPCQRSRTAHDMPQQRQGGD